jgi:hypothetical protein
LLRLSQSDYAEFSSETEGICESPHDDPAKWAAMLTGYFDECGQEKRGLVVVAGFLGSRGAWDKLAIEWPKGFEGSQRKSLHTAALRFERDSERRLLERLGPIPEQCGLVRISGSVNVNDYYHLVEGTVAELHGHGLSLAMIPLVKAILHSIPDHERFELIFEEQSALGFYRDKMLEMIANTMPPHPHYQNMASRGRKVQMAKWSSVPKDSTFLTEPADYLCYHLAHKAEDPNSIRTQWTEPIMSNGKISIQHLTQQGAVNLFAYAPGMTPHPRENLQDFKRIVRSGTYDPWKELFDQDKKQGHG